MDEGQNGRLYSVDVTVGDGEGKCGEIDRVVVNVLAANEAEAERKAVRVFENQGQKAKALGVGLRTKERMDERRNMTGNEGTCEGTKDTGGGTANEGTNEGTKAFS